MKILVPVDDDNVAMAASNATMSLYPAWSSATAYSIGSRVYYTTNGIPYDYEAIAAVTGGANPGADAVSANPRWVRIGHSNRYKVIDRVLSDPAVMEGGSIAYSFDLSQNVTTVAIFGLVGTTVTVSIMDSNNVTIPGSAQTQIINGNPNISNWFEYFFAEVQSNPDMLFTGLPGYSGNRLRVAVSGVGRVEIGEIVFGREIEIGTTLEKPTFGIRDYSRKERDEFGNPIIVERPYSLYGEFDIIYPSARTRNLLDQLAKIRAKPAVFYVPGMDVGRGTMIFGYFTDFSMNLEVGPESYSSITVEGLV